MRMKLNSRQPFVVAAPLALAMLVAGSALPPLAAQSKPASPRFATIREADLRQYLAYISADQLLGREVFTEGFGMAAGYVSAHLEQWGVKPMGENGTYFQTVKLNDVKVATDNTSVTVSVGGQSRTFKNGAGVTFSIPAGGKQSATINGVEFLGYGLYLPGHDDYAGKNMKGKAAIYLAGQPAGLAANLNRILSGRSRHALAEANAAAAISYTIVNPNAVGRGGAGGAPVAPPAAGAPATSAPPPTGAAPDAGVAPPAAGRGLRTMGTLAIAVAPQGTFQTVDNFNRINPPQITANDEFFNFLFTSAPTSFAELKDLAMKGQPLPTFTLPNVTLAFNVDDSYQVLQTMYTHNVVGLVEGTDARLKDTYVLFGAHLDHIGYRPGGTGDVINNGADDDGSGVVSELAIAKAFATGPKPRRSVIFIWHAGEEKGLYGSRYNADFPVVPLDKIDCQLNIDMIGRDNYDNRDADYTNSLFIVGDDRISTDLHNVIVDTNTTLQKPLKLDYELNDPADPETIYYRSDHYSYAAKGIPIAFFTTGLHADYHRVTDTADKIHYEKMARIVQLVYQTGFSLANMDQFIVRDNLGARSGKGFQGKIAK
jgi:peptidase M28-like protein